MEQIKCDREVCSQFLITKCVQIFLEQNERWVSEFAYEFEQSKLADEKNQHLNKFLSTLESEVKRNSIWKSNLQKIKFKTYKVNIFKCSLNIIGASFDQINDAKLAIERAIISRVYTLAMYPNGDADISRDQ